ncbi:MAG: META domain-containing protein [Patescibacteria group bacterium]
MNRTVFVSIVALIAIASLVLFSVNNSRQTSAQLQPPLDDQQTHATTTNSLVGTTWQFERIRYNNDRQVVPVNPEVFQLLFIDENTIEMQLDCNTATATYVKEGSHLAFSSFAVTEAYCPEQPVVDALVEELQAVDTYVIEGNTLFMSLPVDIGQIIFSMN